MPSPFRSLAALVLFAAVALPARAQLSGLYTVGGPSPSFATLADAVAALNAQGVAGPVTFSLRTSVTHGGLVSIDSPAGTSATNTVTFRPAGDATTRAAVQADVPGVANYVVRLNGAQHVRFERLDLAETGAGSAARVVLIENGSADIAFTDCSFTGLGAAATADGDLLTYGAGTFPQRITVTGSTFTYGRLGLALFGSDHLVEGNTFASQTLGGALLNTSARSAVRGNATTTWAASGSDYIGLSVSGAAVVVEDNRVDLGAGTVGLRVTPQLPLAEGTALVRGNMVSVRASGAAAGLSVRGGNADVVHNTVRTAGSAAPALLADAPTVGLPGLRLHGNLLAADGGAEALVISDAALVAASNSNLLHSTGAALARRAGVGAATLAAWQAASGLDANSDSAPVAFAGAATGNLRLAGASLADAALVALPLPGLTPATDLDGAARDPVNPKMGVHEGTPLPPMRDADTGLGFYTVAGTSPDFATPEIAVKHVNRRGLGGAVTLRVRAGTFVGRHVLRTVRHGAAAADPAGSPLTVRAANPAARPLFRHTAAGADDNAVLRLDGATHVVLDRLRLEALGTDHATALDLAPGSAHVSVTDGDLTGPAGVPATGLVRDRALVWLDTGAADHFALLDSRLAGSASGLYAQGAAVEGVRIERNTFAGHTVRAVRLSGPLTPILAGNDVTAAAGFDLTATASAEIRDNVIRATGAAARALVLSNTSATSSAPTQVVNNALRVAGTEPALDVQNGSFVRIAHLSASQGGSGLAVRISGNGATLTHAVLRAAGGAALFASAGALATLTETTLWSDGAVLATVGATNYADAGSLTIAGGFGPGLREIDAAFMDAAVGDLRLAGRQAWDPDFSAPPLDDVPADLLGAARGAVWVHRGAYEGTPFSPLAGVYTVGEHPDFPTLSAFETLADAFAMAEFVGLDAAATFHLRPGTHAGAAFDGHPSLSAERSLRIAAENPLDYALPTVERAGGSGADNYVLRLADAPHVRVERLRIRPLGTTFARGLVLTGATSDVAVDNSLFEGLPGGSTSTSSLIHADGAAGTNLSVSFSTFADGYAGVHVEPPFGTVVTGVVLDGLTSAGSRGAVLTGTQGTTITRSTFQNAGGAGPVLDGRGHLLSGVTAVAAGGNPALTLASGPGAGSPVRVVNSEIASDGVGLQVTDVGQTNAGVSVEHVSIAALYPVSVGGSIVGEGSQLAVRNSLLIGTGQGPALRLQNTNPSPFPYVGAGNALYSPGPLLVQRGLSGFVDLADWKAASGQDATSVVVAVTFEDAAAGDLRFAGPSVGDVRLGGVPWPAVPEDRLGVARSATFPTMGAYESTPSLTPTIRLFVSAYLQGTFLPSTGGLPTMRTDLSAAGRLPLAHPYGGAPWFHTGTESVEPGFFEANPAFVDWVLVGLRATPDGPDLVRRALLLHEDSGIRFGATGTVLSFPVRSGTYTVVVYHRNHLPIASTPRSLTNVLHPIDSSVRLSVPEFVLGGLSAGVQAQQGILALAAGDGDGNGSVLANDRQAVWLPTVGQTGYLSGDFNLDGSVLADDRQTLWAPNVGRQSAVPGASLAPTESAPTKTAPAPAPHRDASTSADQ